MMMNPIVKYSPPLVIMAERKENYEPTEADKTKGTKGGYFCGRCKSEIVLTVSSQQRIASRPDGNLLCVPCVGRNSALAWQFWRKAIEG
jgi:hypothetical protein